mmetsp:Transcript_71816/g.208055  ORF Transcript_71816/g.208055 Transcript_71816/m.208055 type:complete len:343 (+) Transcript_71816:268-1296(+)
MQKTEWRPKSQAVDALLRHPRHASKPNSRPGSGGATAAPCTFGAGAVDGALRRHEGKGQKSWLLADIGAFVSPAEASGPRGPPPPWARTVLRSCKSWARRRACHAMVTDGASGISVHGRGLLGARPQPYRRCRGRQTWREGGQLTTEQPAPRLWAWAAASARPRRTLLGEAQPTRRRDAMATSVRPSRPRQGAAMATSTPLHAVRHHYTVSTSHHLAASCRQYPVEERGGVLSRTALWDLSPTCASPSRHCRQRARCRKRHALGGHRCAPAARQYGCAPRRRRDSFSLPPPHATAYRRGRLGRGGAPSRPRRGSRRCRHPGPACRHGKGTRNSSAHATTSPP